MFLKLSEDGQILFADEIVATYPFIKPLLSLQYNKEKGDTEGKLRNRAKRELMFLYVAYINTGTNEYEFWSQEERVMEGKKLAGLPADFQPSKELQQTIEYIEQFNTHEPLEKAYKAIKALAESTIQDLQNNTSLKLNEKLDFMLKVEPFMKTLVSLETLKGTLQETRKKRGKTAIGNREIPK